jgi:hypothetical protein
MTGPDAAPEAAAAEAERGAARAVTLGHLDPVGALPLLLREYPAGTVVYHEAEPQYLVGGEAWTPHWRRSGVYSRGFVLAHLLGYLPRAQYALPAGRGVALLARAAAAAGRTPRRRPLRLRPRGRLAAGGHCALLRREHARRAPILIPSSA